MKLVINIPCLNEEKMLGKVLSELPKKIDGINKIETQIVDDGSTDKTVEIARKHGCRIVKHPYNKGVGSAFKSGTEVFLQSKGDIFVNIDADRQFNPNDIAKVVKPIVQHRADIVSASRFSGIKPVNMPFIKRFLNQVIAWKVSTIIGYKIPDLTCGFRAYSRESIFKLSLLDPFTYTQESLINAASKKLRVAFVPVRVVYHKERKSRVVKSVIGYINKSALIIIRTVRDAKPLKFFGIPAIICNLLGVVFGAGFLVQYFMTGMTSPFRTWLILCAIFIFLGIQLIIFALLADQIKTSRRLLEEEMLYLKKLEFKK